jgi:hypothetical protein
LPTEPTSIKTLKQINDLTHRPRHCAFGAPCVGGDIVARQQVHGIAACRGDNKDH